MKAETMMKVAGGSFSSIMMMVKRSFCVLFIICSLFILHPSSFILSSPLRPVRATVRVNAESIARNDNLTLGDIAAVLTNEPHLGVQLRAIALGYAPQIGAVRELTKQRIAMAIAAAGFTQEVVEMEAPAITRVRREAQTVDPALVRQAVERSLATTLRSAGSRATLTRLDVPPNIEVPTGVVEVRSSITAVRTHASPFPVAVEFWVDGRLLKRLSVTAQAETFGPVLVAARDLSAKTRLREGDFKVAVVPLARNQSLYFSEPTRLRGASLVQSLKQGDAITTDLIVADIVVKPGDPVRIVGQSGALSIFVMGEARAAGHVGDRIQVKNLQSGLLLQAIVVDEGVVNVRF